MKLKSILSAAGAVLFAALLPCAAFAADYTAEAVVSEDRDRVSVDIAVAPKADESDLTIAGYAFSLNYDPAILRVVAAEEKDVLGDKLYAVDKLGNPANSVIVTDNGEGVLKVGYASAAESRIASKTSIVSVTFDVLKKKDAAIGVDFFSVANNGEKLDTSVKKGVTEANGIIELKKEYLNPKATGDAFGDNNITATDAAYVFELANTSAEYVEELDMDNDGKITVKDALIVLGDVQNGDVY